MNQRDPGVEDEVDQVADPALSQAATAKPKRNGRRLLLMFGLPLVLAIGGGYFYLTGGRYQGHRQRLCPPDHRLAVF